jgi:hypothetical protein
VKFSRAPVRYFCALILIIAGALGILFSPSVGLRGGNETRSLMLNEIREYPWGSAIASSELEIPSIQNGRGLMFMSVFMVGSLSALFGGVHWYAALRNRPLLRD